MRRDRQATKFVEEALGHIRRDALMDRMLRGVLYGRSIGEALRTRRLDSSANPYCSRDGRPPASRLKPEGAFSRPWRRHELPTGGPRKLA